MDANGIIAINEWSEAFNDKDVRRAVWSELEPTYNTKFNWINAINEGCDAFYDSILASESLKDGFTPMELASMLVAEVVHNIQEYENVPNGEPAFQTVEPTVETHVETVVETEVVEPIRIKSVATKDMSEAEATETTDTVADALEVVQTVLADVVDASRVALVEKKHSSRITLDGKTICSMRFGKRVLRFEVSRKATQTPSDTIETVADIVNYSEELHDVASEIVATEEEVA